MCLSLLRHWQMIDLGMGERVGGLLKAVGTPEYSPLEVGETICGGRISQNCSLGRGVYAVYALSIIR